jgi:hypothetical protein
LPVAKDHVNIFLHAGAIVFVSDRAREFVMTTQGATGAPVGFPIADGRMTALARAATLREL